MKAILAAIAVILVACPAFAQIGVAGGGTQEWFKLSKDAEWTSPEVAFTPAILYHVGLNDNGFGESTKGITISFQGTENIGKAQVYGLGGWIQNGPLEFFGDIYGETWAPEITGDREFLFGGGAGLRAEAAGGLPVQLSVRYTTGDGVAHSGVFLGLYK